MRLASLMLWIATGALGLGAVPAAAQITTIDPNTAIDSDLDSPPPPRNDPQPIDQGAYQQVPRDPVAPPPVYPQPVTPPPANNAAADARASAANNTYARD